MKKIFLILALIPILSLAQSNKSGSKSNTDYVFYNVTYIDKQINNEASFTLFNESIKYSHFAYSEKTINLFFLTETGIIKYDLSNITNGKPTRIELLLSSNIDKRRNGIDINPDGTKLAYIDKQNNICVINTTTKKIILIKSIKKYKNYYQNDKSKSYIGNNFNFISNNEIIIGGNKAFGLLNIEKGKIKSIKLKYFENSPVFFKGKGYIYKIINRQAKYFTFTDDFKKLIPSTSNDYYIKSWNYTYKNNKTIRNFDNKYITVHFDKNDSYKILPPEKGIQTITDKQNKRKLSFNTNLYWINNYNLLLGFKEKNKGFVIYNYNNISIEIEKQYFLRALNKNNNTGYEEFLRLYPNSKYKELCKKKLQAFYLKELDKAVDPLQENFTDESEISLYYKKTLQSYPKNRIKELYRYMTKYPHSMYNHEIRKAIDNAYENEYNKISTSENVYKYERYLSDYPKSSFNNKVKAKANVIYKAEFDTVCKINTIESYNKYNNSYPKSKYTTQVTKKIQTINDNIKDEKELYERAKMGNGKSYSACIRYLNKYPNGIYIEEVKANKKVFDDRRNAIETGKNKKLWKLGNKICILKYEDIVLMSGVLDSWNEDKSMAKIKLNLGMWDKQGTKYRGDDLVKNNYIWIQPDDGWHICLDDEIDILEENSNMPGTTSNYSSSNSGNSTSIGRNCTWTETLTLENNDGSLIGSMFSSITNINFPIKYTGVIEQEIGGNYKIIISSATVKLSGWASTSQLKYRGYANELVSKNIGQTRVKNKNSVKIY